MKLAGVHWASRVFCLMQVVAILTSRSGDMQLGNAFPSSFVDELMISNIVFCSGLVAIAVDTDFVSAMLFSSL
jgi:hypothetical protein